MKKIGIINACIHGAVLAGAAALALYLSRGGILARPPLFYVDQLSGFFILTIAVVNFASALYSTGYIARDLENGRISLRKARLYYVLFNLFALTMFLVTVFDNLGFMWVSIEMTTLVSAFLVGFYNDKRSVEAAWKYLILCSVGITPGPFFGDDTFLLRGFVARREREP
jgi:Formate hydrogenlyase subunit 3/Multisubunit Na+/H+ antiporter, MnhD subunit